VVNSYATGLQGMVRAMALDLKPIRVNLVSPGAVDTDLWKPFGEEGKQKMFEEMEKKLPVGKVGRAEDVAESFLYLMKDHNVTGAMVSTSGGSLLVG
jgi:NAD(P)-dependent dehydrogenase (short-subunit alcohol dehydrogenase family)